MKTVKIVVPTFDKKDVDVVKEQVGKFLECGISFFKQKMKDVKLPDFPKVVKEAPKEVVTVEEKPVAPAPITGATYVMEISVAGVMFEGRQAVIKALKGTETCELRHMPTMEFPNRFGVVIGDRLTGWVPDNGYSLAKILVDKQAKGKAFRVTQWIRVGSMEKNVGLRVFVEVQE